ncbi:MAG: hypothetical protein AAF639_16700 [Chloroflexota bacterium]
MQFERKLPNSNVYWPKFRPSLHDWLPSKGNVLFTLLTIWLPIGTLLYAQSVGAISLGVSAVQTNTTSTIPYQGRLTDASGNPLNDTIDMSFRLYATASGGSSHWTEQWADANAVQVSDGLFNVMLGSLTPIDPSIITGNDSVFLGVTVGADSEMTPRVQLGSVSTAVQARTVPNGSITNEKLDSGAVQSDNLSLSNAEACQSEHLSLNFPGGDYDKQEISDLSLDLSLNQPSKVLVGIYGLARVTNDGDTGISLWFDDNSRPSLVSYYGRGDNHWYQVDAQKIFNLSAGDHSIRTYGYSNASGTMTVHGYYHHQTCIYYLVLGEQ